MTVGGTEPADLYARAVAHTRVAILGVRDGQLGDATPCTDWDVAELRSHIILGATSCARSFGMSPPKPSDPVAAYDAATQAAITGMTRPGALENIVTRYDGSRTPGAQLATLMAMSNLVHGWDLAEATGQSTKLPDDLVEIFYAEFKPRMDTLRKGDAFATSIDLDNDASTQDRLLGMMGRQAGSRED
jgi:uncharacterized protein (TIGR03086 family)